MAAKNKSTGFDPATLTGPAKKVWLAGLGALATAEQEGNKLFRVLVERGEELEGRGRERIESLVGSVGEAAGSVKSDVGSRLDQVGGNLDELVLRAMRQLGVPSREELEILTTRIEELAASLENLPGRAKTSAGQKAVAKTAPAPKAAKGTTTTKPKAPAGASKPSAKKD